MDKSEKKKFLDNYFNKDERNKIKWLEYKNEKMPDSLFKYTRANKHVYDLICDDLLFLPKIEALNDPYEIQLFYDIDKLAKEISFKNRKIVKKEVDGAEIEAQYVRDLNPSEIRELNYIFRDINEKIKNRTSLSCFAERNDINPMWAHYADNHAGICIEYDLKNCKDSFLKTLCFPVDYVEKNDVTDDLISTFIYGDFEELLFLLKVTTTKSKDWEYEKEWRIVFMETNKQYVDFYSDKHYAGFIKPNSIFLGLKIDEKVKQKIIDICKFRKINLYQMVKKEYNFILKPEAILEF